MTNRNARKVGLFINGELKAEFELNKDNSEVQVFEVKNINIPGTFTLELRHTASGSSRAQITIDNLTWTTFGEPKELTDEEYLDIAGQYVTSELAWLNDAEVSNSLDLPQHHPNYKDLRFEWESSNPSVISNDGVYTQPEEDTEVTLILKVFIPSNTTDVADMTFEYTVTAKGKPQQGSTQTITYTFTNQSWGANYEIEGGSSGTENWTSGKDGNGFTAGQGVQVTAKQSGANGTSTRSFTNVTSIEVIYSTNKSKGKGNITLEIGGAEVLDFVADYKESDGDGRVTRSAGVVPIDNLSGKIKITVTCTENSIYIHSIKITYIPE